MRRLLPLVLLLSACGRDLDRDGSRGRDCAPNDPAVNPDADEVCNGIDDDCDGFVDEGVAIVAFRDEDGDGYGDPAQGRRVCELPEDGSLDPTDCDDRDASAHPGGTEICDARDDDCDGEIDEGAKSTFYADQDGDGHGDPAATTEACFPPEGFAVLADDCDDGDAARWTDAPEVCDEIDNDCDGQTDEDLPPTRVWADVDGDGHGDPGAPGLACGPVTGWSGDDRDCDDADPDIGPSAAEIADNGFDEDCDGWVDEIAVPDHYASLDDAIAVAGAGDVIQLGEGTWVGAANLAGLDVTLAGEGCERTTLYGDGGGSTVTMTAGLLADLTVAGGDADLGGGLVAAGDVEVHRACFVGNHATDGGGAGVLLGTLTVRDALFARNYAAERGGGLYAGPGTVLDVKASRLVANTAEHDGGGISGVDAAMAVSASTFVANRGLSGGGIAAEKASGTASLSVVDATFDANVVTYYGAAIWESSVLTTLEGLLLTNHEPPANNPYLLAFWGSGSPAVGAMGSWNNGGRETVSGYVLDAVRADPRFLDRDPDAPPEAWDLRLGHGSGLVDAGSLTHQDRDGTRADVGAYAGPDAPDQPDYGYAADADSDGLPDGWEDQHGLNRWIDDAGEDPDADGLANADELALDTDPSVADTDADGVSDGDEASSSDPRDPSDHAPLAHAGRRGWGVPGEPVALDGSLSFDPNGDALAFAWTVVSAPSGSAVTGVDAPSSAGTTLTADVAGAYLLELAVSDGAITVTDTVEVQVVDAVVVPDDLATVQAAVDASPSGGAVAVRPGTYREAIDLGGRSLVLVGLGEPHEVVLDARGGGPVVTAALGETVQLARMTLTGGAAPDGGGVWAVGGEVELDQVVVAGNAAGGSGGGIGAFEAHVTATDSLFWANDAGDDGGGVFVDEADLDLVRVLLADNTAGDKGGGVHTWTTAGGVQRVRASAFTGNDAAYGGGLYRYGGGSGSNTALENVAFVGNRTAVRLNTGDVWLTNVLVAEDASTAIVRDNGRLFALYTALWGNVADFSKTDDDPGALAGTVRDDPALTLWIADGDPTNDLLAPRPGSPLVDAGRPEWSDPDRTRADIGAWGGPEASRDLPWFLADRDGDGMSDGFEVFTGLDPAADDANADADGDGLANADEWAASTDPGDEDTDGDGLPDGVDDDPRDPSAHRPVADAGEGLVIGPGETAALSGSGTDPDGDPLAFAWTFAEVPSGSALTNDDLAGADTATPSFLPDTPGRFVLALVVSDGWQSSEPSWVEVRIWQEVTVPGDYATLDDALAAILPYDHVLLGAGDHAAALEPAFPFVLEGEDRDTTRLVGVGLAPVVHLSASELTLRHLTVTGGMGAYGGGVHCEDATLVAEDVAFVENVGGQGGALHLDTCATTFTDVDVVDNLTATHGGGVYVKGGALDWVRGRLSANAAPEGYGGGLYLNAADTALRNVVIARNRGLQGSGAYQTGTGAVLDLSHVAVAGNTEASNALYLYSGDTTIDHSLLLDNDGYAVRRDTIGTFGARLTSTRNAWWGNGTGDVYPATDLGTEDLLVDPDVVRYGRDVALADLDLRLRGLSPLIDAGDASAADPDGGVQDVGAWGGPDAGAGWDDGLADADADDLFDLWEAETGATDPASDDDGDGLSALEELLLGTHPASLDSDEDGVDDPDEIAGGSDPADPSDNRPIADAGVDLVADPGDTVSLTASRSSDPNGDPLTYAWRFAAIPGTSALTDADLTGATTVFPTFSPDVPGTFVVEVVVDDGVALSEPDTVRVIVAGDVAVPADYATIAEAFEAIEDGYAILVEAGTWPCSVDLDSKDVAIVGAGSAITALEPDGLGPILFGRRSEALRLEGVTLLGAIGGKGAGVRLGGTGLSPGSLELVDVAFEDLAAVYGAGMYVTSATVVATDVRAVDVRALRLGGAAYVNDGSVFATRLQVAASVAGEGGAAIYASEAPVTLTNALFQDLEGAQGAAVHLTSSAAGTLTDPWPLSRLDHVTAVHGTSTSQGGFLYALRSDATVTSSIVAWNGRYGIFETSGVYTQRSSLLHGNEVADAWVTGAEPVAGTDGNLDGDPLFTAISDDGDWTNDDLTLQTTSPAVGAGIDGDMGAYGGPEAF